MIKEWKLAAVALIAILAACGGGGGGGSVPAAGSGAVAVATTPAAVATTPAAVPSGEAVASFTITLAKGTFAQSARRTQAVGTGTQSIVFTLLQQNGTPVTGTPQTFGLTASSAGCAVSQATGNLGCTLQVNAPIGSDVFLAQTYSNSNGTGSLTGSGAVALSVGINASNTASIVLNAQVANVYVAAGSFYIGDPSLLEGSSRRAGTTAVRRLSATAVRRPQQLALPVLNSIPIFVIAVDSAGNTILNPSAYSSPVYLQLTFIPFLTPDVTVSVTYAAGDPSPCTPGTTASANNFYQSVAVCSPSDAITATVSPIPLADPSYYAYIFGYTSAAQLAPTPMPSTLPSSPPTTSSSFVAIEVAVPTPSPSPTANGILPVTGQ